MPVALLFATATTTTTAQDQPTYVWSTAGSHKKDVVDNAELLPYSAADVVRIHRSTSMPKSHISFSPLVPVSKEQTKQRHVSCGICLQRTQLVVLVLPELQMDNCACHVSAALGQYCLLLETYFATTDVQQLGKPERKSFWMFTKRYWQRMLEATANDAYTSIADVWQTVGAWSLHPRLSAKIDYWMMDAETSSMLPRLLVEKDPYGNRILQNHFPHSISVPVIAVLRNERLVGRDYEPPLSWRSHAIDLLLKPQMQGPCWLVVAHNAHYLAAGLVSASTERAHPAGYGHLAPFVVTLRALIANVEEDGIGHQVAGSVDYFEVVHPGELALSATVPQDEQDRTSVQWSKLPAATPSNKHVDGAAIDGLDRAQDMDDWPTPTMDKLSGRIRLLHGTPNTLLTYALVTCTSHERYGFIPASLVVHPGHQTMGSAKLLLVVVHRRLYQLWLQGVQYSREQTAMATTNAKDAFLKSDQVSADRFVLLAYHDTTAQDVARAAIKLDMGLML
ncbi:hypothetical protein RI367_003383 [Sorochytrium milnesiophthora]